MYDYIIILSYFVLIRLSVSLTIVSYIDSSLISLGTPAGRCSSLEYLPRSIHFKIVGAISINTRLWALSEV